jgi:CheY-like chemotaxis protein/HPt (histidine-containing phosphotransfer) domain-containing protein
MQMPEIDGAELGRRIKEAPELHRTRLIMMTSVGQRGDAPYFRQMGFSGYLTKPVRKSQLRECLNLVMGRKEPPDDAHAEAIVTRHTVAEAVKHRTRILLAEDNITNQKVALAILKKLGYRADTVANGLEVLRALKSVRYDLVLMDCQMPEMDGYEATRRIRNAEEMMNDECGMVKEKDTEEGRYHSSFTTCHPSFRIPIIAITAHAMKGDRQKCIEAGMDDYISKPIRPGELADALEKWLSKASAEEEAFSPQILTETDPEETAVRETTESVIFDERILRERLMGDEGLLKTVVDAFLKDIPGQLASLRSSIDAGDFGQAGQVVHKIKGASGNVAAMALHNSALQLEQAVRSGDLATIRMGLERLVKEFATIKHAMTGVE